MARNAFVSPAPSSIFAIVAGGAKTAGVLGQRTIVITKQASGTATIDPLMEVFNAVAWTLENPASWQPSIFVGWPVNSFTRFCLLAIIRRSNGRDGL